MIQSKVDIWYCITQANKCKGKRRNQFVDLIAKKLKQVCILVFSSVSTSLHILPSFNLSDSDGS